MTTTHGPAPQDDPHNDVRPDEHVSVDVPVLEWRRNGDVLEGLVETKIDGETITEWLPALDLRPDA